VDRDVGPFVIVEATAFQQTIGQLEAERLDEMQIGAGDRAQSDDVARVRRYLWFDQYDVHDGHATALGMW